MKNKDLYKEEIFNIATTGGKVAVVNDKPVNCATIQCIDCDFFKSRCSCQDNCIKWMNKEAMDWTKVSVDTKILVRDTDRSPWQPRYFASFEGGKVYAWDGGTTSYTADGHQVLWNQAKLFEEDKK
nr:MAG TPA: hypothetical protein [Caudoviricetes sp.]